MDWTTIITTLLGLLLGGGGSILYFRPKLKEAKVGADAAQTKYLEDRIESMGKLYESQGKILDEVRARLLEMGKEMQTKDERINQLETENRNLNQKVTNLENELAAYKIIAKNGNNK